MKLYPQGKCTRSASSQQGTGNSKSNLCFTEQIWLIGVCYRSLVMWIKKNLLGATVNTEESTHLPSVYLLTAPLQEGQDMFAKLILKTVLHGILQNRSHQEHGPSFPKAPSVSDENIYNWKLYEWTLLFPEVLARKHLRTVLDWVRTAWIHGMCLLITQAVHSFVLPTLYTVLP